MAAHFNCTYLHETVQGKFISTSDEVKNNLHIENTINLITRLLNVTSLIKEDYIMWLEDDVKINNQITDIFRHDLNGFCPNTFRPDLISNLIKEGIHLNENTTYRWSGHGGSVFKKDTLVECLNDSKIINFLLKNWIMLGFDELASDFFISLLINIHKGTIGPYDGHADCGHELDPSNRICVQHQFKKYYGAPWEQLKNYTEISDEELNYLLNSKCFLEGNSMFQDWKIGFHTIFRNKKSYINRG
jgi:hypothetical protein